MLKRDTQLNKLLTIHGLGYKYSVSCLTFQGNTAPTTPMPGVIEKMKEFNAHRKLRGGMIATLAASTWARLGKQ